MAHLLFHFSRRFAPGTIIFVTIAKCYARLKGVEGKRKCDAVCERENGSLCGVEHRYFENVQAIFDSRVREIVDSVYPPIAIKG